MKLTLLVYIICQWHFSLAVVSCKNEYLSPYNCSLQADYYWRDYDGTIPNDAIAGGLDEGQITYVGQVLYYGSLLPANVYPCQKEALSTLGNKAFRVQTSIKILCGQYKERFRWISTTTKEIHLLTDFTLITGGFSVGYTLHIGRVNLEQRIIIGKFFPFDIPYKDLNIAKRNGSTQSFQSFEVLAYENRYDSNSCEANCVCIK